MIDPAGPETAAPLDEKCIIGEYCTLHGFIHGAEAEELRERFEKMIADCSFDDKGRIRLSTIRRVLDEVDARDSCAYLDAKAKSAAPSEGPQQDPIAEHIEKLFQRFGSAEAVIRAVMDGTRSHVAALSASRTEP